MENLAEFVAFVEIFQDLKGEGSGCLPQGIRLSSQV
jgi:hypothetical protein